jgi:UDPglucose 6-dehydrogenase
LEEGSLVLISSQLPVGTTRRLEESCRSVAAGRRIDFACIPENLRLGKAVSLFAHPDRVVAGIRNEDLKPRIAALFEPFTKNIEWMSVESAEMTKHALNAFLGMSVSFANELGVLCERLGADAKEVERGLKSESRVGPGAYLSPGAAFAGGTLARDLRFLENLGHAHELPMHLIGAVLRANNAHREWARLRIQEQLGNPCGLTIGIWGLSYKAGTSATRRSPAVELASWLHSQGASVKAYDPSIREIPKELEGMLQLVSSPVAAAESSAALVVEAGWADFLSVDAGEIASRMVMPRLVLDASRYLAGTLGKHPQLRYFGVGAPAGKSQGMTHG